ADTLEAMRAARAGGAIRVLGIVNVVGSTIAREADGGIYLHAGPEIGVASTKAFTSQIVALTLLGLYLGHHRGLAPEAGPELGCRLRPPPGLIPPTRAPGPPGRPPGRADAARATFLFLRRGGEFPVALAGA